ncbi:MAG: pyridoxine 5'-phosphate synthase [Deltaproteobacteria bacterium 13_1_40CM_4_54_4]|nr:MAG: pyridoxine 5'-phosphate synthase [Deltaproteobacteria bacterium 13_1_40CM_4_54_4]TMB73246.1 MAG: pyridoxine 5'-phosphate synthase [Deltaproteobacteria bacterium]
MIRLGVNVDHVATVRQARRAQVPDPMEAALLAEKAGADGITVHLREDRRHIQERDVELLRERLKTKLNLEMAVTPAMVAFAETLRPDDACFVPEKREELTTEGGLDIVAHRRKIQDSVKRLQDRGIHVSLFVDPEEKQIETSKEVGADAVEVHTGTYCNAAGAEREKERRTVASAVSLAYRLGLEVHAGHGLDYENVLPIAGIHEIVELNIGHSIIARAVVVGIEQAVREMKALLKKARG